MWKRVLIDYLWNKYKICCSEIFYLILLNVCRDKFKMNGEFAVLKKGFFILSSNFNGKWYFYCLNNYEKWFLRYLLVVC